MKKPGLWLGALFALCAFHLPAQVTVEVILEQDQFLPGEPLPAAARIVNRSGQTLRLGKDEGWLTFAIESRDGFIVLKSGEAPVAGEFTLRSSERATKRVDLAPYFSLGRSGRYSIRATVNVNEWNQQITSNPKTFDVIEGARIWEQDIGVPTAPGETNRFPEVRKYTLQQANYLKQLTLYFRLTDASGKISKVFALGPMLSFGQPEPQVDRFSNLHVLYQDGPRSFGYTVINPNGDVIKRNSYDFTTRPRLKIDADGNLAVSGGTRRISVKDVPPSKLPEDDTPAPER